jgi:hypothetical protein
MILLTAFQSSNEIELANLRLKVMMPPPDFDKMKQHGDEVIAVMFHARAMLETCPSDLSTFVDEGHLERIVADPVVRKLKSLLKDQFWRAGQEMALAS